MLAKPGFVTSRVRCVLFYLDLTRALPDVHSSKHAGHRIVVSLASLVRTQAVAQPNSSIDLFSDSSVTPLAPPA